MASADDNSHYDYIFKLILIGDIAVGKTNLILRFARNQFLLSTKSTIGVEFATRALTIEGNKIQNQIWDTAGQERFRTVVSQLYRGSDGVLVVFDLSKPDTLENVPRWIEEIYQNTRPNLPIILIGNKCDLVDDKDPIHTEALNIATRFNISYMITSAMNATNVEKAFITLVTNIYQKTKGKSDMKSVQPIPNVHDKPEDTIPIKSDDTIILPPRPPIHPNPEKKTCC